MKFKVPKAIKNGHENLCKDLQSLIKFGGTVGKEAEILNKIMSAHFKQEEKYAMPPLGLLLTLTEGGWNFDAQEAIKMSEMLHEKLSELKKEHGDIMNILKKFKKVAEEENNHKAKQFVKDLLLHVEIEDQVLYPTTLLIGDYLKNTNKK